MEAATTEPLARGHDFGLEGRVVVVTGAGQGIGREYVRQFAAAGAVPVVADRNAPAAHEVVREIEAAGGRALGVEVDVADPDSVQAMADGVLARLGRIDGLVNNAAVFSTLRRRAFGEIPIEEWRLVLDVNVTGSYLAARAVAPAMIEAGWGRIVNITSSAVSHGVPGYLHYVTSKAAVVGMTNALARELGPHGINVNAVQPSSTTTEVDRGISDAGKQAVVALQCLPRESVPTDLAGLVLFLCTEAAAFVTGQTIACDGGLTHR